MASYVAKKASRKFLGNKAAEIEPQDPHYETYQDAKGKKRQRKRAMPTGLSKRDEKVLVCPRVSVYVRLKSEADGTVLLNDSALSVDELITSTKVSAFAGSNSVGLQSWDLFRMCLLTDEGLEPIANLAPFRSGAGDIAQFLLGFFLVLKKCKEAESVLILLASRLPRS